MKLVVQIPCYNEENTLAEALASIGFTPQARPTLVKETR